MSLTTTVDMDKICRICLKSEPELYLIFEQKFAFNNESLATILTELTMYKVNRYDELPHHMCSNCVELAKSAFIFKRTCEEAYRQLIGMLATDNCNFIASSSQVKMETEALLLEKSTQTDYSMYPCERCEQKFFTFDVLRMHREAEHKASAIVCRFCSKSFNSGYTSHNQCSICKRQFTRRDHMLRHLAVIHKIVEIGDGPGLTNREDDSSKSTEASNELQDELQIVENHCGGKSELETDLQAIASISHSSANHTSPPGSDDERVADNRDVKQSLSDEEDEKPLSEFIRLPRKNFLEVLIDEGRNDDQLKSSTVDVPNNMKFEYEASPEKALDDESIAEQCKKSTKLRAIDCSSSIGVDVHKEHKCITCDKVFRRFSTLQRHMLNHKQKKSLTCKICAKSFTRTDFLRNHMNITHDAAKSIKCDECNTEFTHFTHYKRHREMKHTLKTHSCDICQKSFRTRLYMQRHMESHNKKRFVCKECSQRFLTKDELKTHIKSEGHDKPLLCPECGLRCKTSNILMVHMRRHKGEKPFKCKFCSKGFPRMDDLRIHERYHTGEKSHFCETCGKGFQRKYNLTIHMRVHTGEKPYKCEYCPHAFTQSNDLKAHIRRHTGERFRCEICGAPFLQGYQMRQHKLTEHGVKESPPTQRVEKYTSPEEQEQQIKQNLQRELAKSIPSTGGKSAETLESQESANVSSSTYILEPTTNTQKDLSFLSI